MKWTAADLRKTLPLVITKGETSDVMAKLAGRFYSNKTWYLLRRDAPIPFTASAGKRAGRSAIIAGKSARSTGRT